MNDEPTTLPFVRYEEAMAKVRSFSDPAREQFVMRGITIMINDYGEGAVAESPVDVLYLVDLLSKLFDERDVLLRIFSGEDLRGFDEE